MKTVGYLYTHLFMMDDTMDDIFPIHKSFDIKDTNIELEIRRNRLVLLWSNGDRVIHGDRLPEPMLVGDRFSVNRVTESLDNSVDVDFVDSTYRHVDFKQLKEVLSASGIANGEYVKEKNDCDDFARRAYNYVRDWYGSAVFGKVTGKPHWVDSKHMWNFFIDSEWKLHWYEPQSDKWATPKKKDRIDDMHF